MRNCIIVLQLCFFSATAIAQEPRPAIVVNETTVGDALKLIGKYDDEFKIYACGHSSGHSNTWYTFKKWGLAVYTNNYIPERQGIKNDIVRNMGLFDTTNLGIMRSTQSYAYYDGMDYMPVNITNLGKLYGEAKKTLMPGDYYTLQFIDNPLVFWFRRSDDAFTGLTIDTPLNSNYFTRL